MTPGSKSLFGDWDPCMRCTQEVVWHFLQFVQNEKMTSWGSTIVQKKLVVERQDVGSWAGLGGERFRDSHFVVVMWGGDFYRRFTMTPQIESVWLSVHSLFNNGQVTCWQSKKYPLFMLVWPNQKRSCGEARGCETPETVLWLKIWQMAAGIRALELSAFCHFGLFPECGGFFEA